MWSVPHSYSFAYGRSSCLSLLMSFIFSGPFFEVPTFSVAVLCMYHLSVLGVRSNLHLRHSRFSFIRLPYFLLCFTLDLFSVCPQLIFPFSKTFNSFSNSFLTCILTLLFLPILTISSAIFHLYPFFLVMF